MPEIFRVVRPSVRPSVCLCRCVHLETKTEVIRFWCLKVIGQSHLANAYGARRCACAQIWKSELNGKHGTDARPSKGIYVQKVPGTSPSIIPVAAFFVACCCNPGCHCSSWTTTKVPISIHLQEDIDYCYGTSQGSTPRRYLDTDCIRWWNIPFWLWVNCIVLDAFSVFAILHLDPGSSSARSKDIRNPSSLLKYRDCKNMLTDEATTLNNFFVLSFRSRGPLVE